MQGERKQENTFSEKMSFHLKGHEKGHIFLMRVAAGSHLDRFLALKEVVTFDGVCVCTHMHCVHTKMTV